MSHACCSQTATGGSQVHTRPRRLAAMSNCCGRLQPYSTLCDRRRKRWWCSACKHQRAAPPALHPHRWSPMHTLIPSVQSVSWAHRRMYMGPWPCTHNTTRHTLTLHVCSGAAELLAAAGAATVTCMVRTCSAEHSARACTVVPSSFRQLFHSVSSVVPK